MRKVLQMHSGAPVIDGTVASRHLRVPGYGRRCLSDLVLIYLFIPDYSGRR